MKRDCRTYRVWVSDNPRDLEALNDADARQVAKESINPGHHIERIELLPDEVRNYSVRMSLPVPPPVNPVRAKSTIEALRITDGVLSMLDMDQMVHAVDAAPVL